MFHADDRQFAQGAAIALDCAAHPATMLPAPLARLLDRADRIDLVVDLGSRIGSRAWFRGASTCAALCWSAIHFAPGLTPLPVPAARPLAEAQWQEERALGLAPLAYGGDTGRRMGATRAVEWLANAPERPSLDLTATLGLGDGFAHVLERAGVAEGEAQRVAAMVGNVIPIDAVKPGTRIDLTLGRRADQNQPRPLDLMRFRAAFDLKLAVNRVDGALKLTREPIPVDDTPLRVSGTIGPSLFRTARAMGVPGAAIAQYLKAIASRINPRTQVAARARFDMVIAQRRAATGEVQYGDLIYAGLDQGPNRQLQMLRWTDAGRDEWFDATGTGETHNGMVMPVNGRQTSGFGMRVHPILGYSRMHQGVDLAAPYGTPIIAAMSGTVTFAGRHGGHGNFVQLYANKDLGTGYGHMSRIAVRVGQQVRQGEIIGYVGSTGLSTGPHLHFEMYRSGATVNPMTAGSFKQTDQLAGAELGQFRARLASLMVMKTGAQPLPRVQAIALVTAGKSSGAKPVAG